MKDPLQTTMDALPGWIWRLNKSKGDNEPNQFSKVVADKQKQTPTTTYENYSLAVLR